MKYDLLYGLKAQIELATNQRYELLSDVRTTVFLNADSSQKDLGQAVEESDMGCFVLDATANLAELQRASDLIKAKFKEVLLYLTQDECTEPANLVGFITSFYNDLDTVRCQLKTSEKRLFRGAVELLCYCPNRSYKLKMPQLKVNITIQDHFFMRYLYYNYACICALGKGKK